MEEYGRPAGCMEYIGAQWREHSIRAARFAPCPVCGGAVAGQERRWTRLSTGEHTVFYEARCLAEGCGYRYIAHEGTRDEFVAAANRRTAHETH